MGAITLELGKAAEPRTCHCCGKDSHVVQGFIYEDGKAHGVYYARWSEGHPEEGVRLAVALGEWGEDWWPVDCYAVALEVQQSVTQPPRFQVLSPERFSWGETEFLGRRLSRDEALARPELPHLFQVAEHVVRDDSRVRAEVLFP